MKRIEERQQARDNCYKKNWSVGKSFGCISSSLCLVAQCSSRWLADSGATHHMTEQRSSFTIYRKILPGTWIVNSIGGVKQQEFGISTVEVIAAVNGKEVDGELREVLHVPGIEVSWLGNSSGNGPIVFRHQSLFLQGPDNSHSRIKSCTWVLSTEVSNVKIRRVQPNPTFRSTPEVCTSQLQQHHPYEEREGD